MEAPHPAGGKGTGPEATATDGNADRGLGNDVLDAIRAVARHLGILERRHCTLSLFSTRAEEIALPAESAFEKIGTQWITAVNLYSQAQSCRQ